MTGADNSEEAASVSVPISELQLPAELIRFANSVPAPTETVGWDMLVSLRLMARGSATRRRLRPGV